jgi:hypothetical protein
LGEQSLLSQLAALTRVDFNIRHQPYWDAASTVVNRFQLPGRLHRRPTPASECSGRGRRVRCRERPRGEPPHQIVLRSRNARADPTKTKDAQTGGGAVLVEQPERNTILVTMTGAAVRVLFASGYVEEHLSDMEKELMAWFVKKPYRPAEPVAAVEEALRGRANRSTAGGPPVEDHIVPAWCGDTAAGDEPGR